MDETTLDLVAGGFHHCDPSWNKHADAIDQCFKVYYPVAGSASVKLGGQTYPLRSGHVYFIPGYRLESQACRSFMDVYWLHFHPRSLYLSYLLTHVSQIHQWKAPDLAIWKETYTHLDRFFAARTQGTFYRIQGMLLHLIADVLEQYNFSHMSAVDPVFEQLQPAIAYMDDHYLENPHLEEISQAAHLAPNYFHRKFTQTFQVTPYAYVLQRRMSVARQLLLGTPLTIRDVAARSGYDNPFHFSRVFRKHFGVSPSRMRSQVRI